jgi:alpha-beta hydrolase superfamily lysophospholipase
LRFDLLEATMPAGMTLWMALLLAGDETLTAEDGTKIAATYEEAKGKKSPAAVLVPMYGDTRAAWKAFAEEAAKRGVATIAIDPRGHGKSDNPARTPIDQWGAAEWLDILKDIRAAKAFLERKGHAKIVVVGASIGASLTLEYGVADEKLAGIALLSISTNLTGRAPKDDIARYGKRPVFFAWSPGDEFAPVSKEMSGAARGAVTTSSAKSGHGTEMIPEITKGLLDWILEVAK